MKTAKTNKYLGSYFVLAMVLIMTIALIGCGKKAEKPAGESGPKETEKYVEADEPETLTEVDEVIEPNDSVIENEIEPGIYYDEEIYDSDDFDAGFVGVALNPDGKALISFQDFGWGTWTKEGELNIDHRLNWKQQITGEDGCIYTEDGERLVKAPVSVWPVEFDEFMEFGKIPTWMTDMIWQDEYWSLLYDLSDMTYDSDRAIHVSGNEEALNDLIENLPAVEYYLYDMDMDDIPELVVKFGTCEADYFGAVFTIDDEGSIAYLGSVALGHSDLFGDANVAGILLQWAHMGTQMLDRMIVKGDRLDFVSLFEENINVSSNGDYTDVSDIVQGAYYMEPIAINNLDAISQYRNTDSTGKINFTFEHIKSSEDYIRYYVNSEATDDDKVILKAGEDGCPYARWYYYIYDQPVFAYYYDSQDGDVDQRYYFECGQMIEWIEGNGNNDSSRIRHYATDDPLDERWDDVEHRILTEAAMYR